MRDVQLNRREILAGLATAGGAGVTAGAGTVALYSDEEVVDGSFAAGTLDLRVDWDGGSSEGRTTLSVDLSAQRTSGAETFTVRLPDDGANNPAYGWLRLSCPKGAALARNLQVRVVAQCPGGEESELASGTLSQVANRLRDGVPLDPDCESAVPGERACLQPGSPLDVLFSWELDGRFAGPAATATTLEFVGRQCRHGDGTTSPFRERQPCRGLSVSYIAFCRVSGGAVEPQVAGSGFDEDGPQSADWTTESDVDYVVVKSGQYVTIYDYRGETVTEGTATTGGDPAADFYGTQPNSRSSAPCALAADVVGDTTFPDDGTSVKLEYEDGAFVREDDDGRPDRDSGNGGDN